MATTRIKDISKTTTDLASDTYGVFDGATNGTQKMARNDMYADWAAAYVAAPTTYKLAPLNSGTNKIDATYLPTSGDTPKGGWNASTNSPSLIDGTGTAGDYYDVTTAGSQDLGSGSITFTVGDVVKYDGSVWYKIDSVANFLDGYSTAATSRTALEVNSIDEDAEATGTKLVGPALYFRGAGPNDYLEVADDAKLSFTDGTDDLPFSVSAWVKLGDATQFAVTAKYGTTVANKEWFFGTGASDQLSLIVIDTSGNFERIQTDTALTGYEGQWIHVAASYAGAGPSAASGNAFSAAADGMTLHVNGQAVPSTEASSGTYTGMSDSSQAVWVGRYLNNYAKGHIKDVKLYNRSLTADEVAQLARGNDLGFADEWGGATATSGTLTVGKRYRLRDWITGDDFTNVGAGSNADGVEFIATGTTPTTWTNSSVVENIGTLADFRAENFIADKLIDLSSNNFVGTNNGATLVGGRKALQLDTDGAAAGNNVLSVFNGSSHLAYVTDKGDLNANSISSGASTELTIATGAVTATKSYHTIDTESDAASDDLDTISGGRAGQMLIVQANNSARSVVLKDGTGNLKLSGDITLDNAEDTATLVSDGTSWYLIATSNNGA